MACNHNGWDMCVGELFGRQRLFKLCSQGLALYWPYGWEHELVYPEKQIKNVQWIPPCPERTVIVQLPPHRLGGCEGYLVMVEGFEGAGVYFIRPGGYSYLSWRRLPSMAQIEDWYRVKQHHGYVYFAMSDTECVESIVLDILAYEEKIMRNR